jgi:hypothetical protein
LTELVRQRFDVRHQIRELEIQRIEARLEHLKEELAERAERKDSLIAEQVEEHVEQAQRDDDERRGRGDWRRERERGRDRGRDDERFRDRRDVESKEPRGGAERREG